MAAEAADSTTDPDSAFAKLSMKNNPYSFKKFVKKSSDDVSIDLGISKKKRKPKTDVSTDLPFPDLNDRDFTAKTHKTDNNGDNPFSFKTFLTQKETKVATQQLPTLLAVELSASSSSAESDDASSPTVLHPARQTSGEALLTRVAVDSSSSGSSFEDDDPTNDIDHDSGPTPLASHLTDSEGGEVERLRADNEELKRAVTEYKEQLRKEYQRYKVLEQQMKVLKKKEKEEAMALEAVVKRAEENLQLTTDRALQAESKVTKLKKTVKSLQDQLAQQHGQASGGGHQEQLLQQVKERTSYTAQQMDLAANKAEVTLKDLLAGVDTLRHLSQVLASVDKITDCTEAPLS